MQTEIKVGVNLKRLRQEKGWSLGTKQRKKLA